uniref:NADH-ubiquinone oxidoreductase chain 6 n=1 Tax=Blepephaeus succinctor TaxID=583413 RepID=A0A5B9RFN1_9CUCU|nr:NADH dehydrogenase subunit 6 [Blepephaeus succinctor]QEG58664.1 NADH dehydrogenase subunit 6 [Blepephaeus succinctor]
MTLMLINLMIMFSIMFMFLKHPLSMGLILIIQTTMIALLTGMMNYNFWFSYIIFLIMIGGMLILFIYMTSIASNEKFKISYILMIMFLLTIIIMIMLMLINDQLFFNMNILNNSFYQTTINFKYSLNKFINWPMNMIFFMMIIYLFITLIMVVKITNIQSGPLRQKF